MNENKNWFRSINIILAIGITSFLFILYEIKEIFFIYDENGRSLLVVCKLP